MKTPISISTLTILLFLSFAIFLNHSLAQEINYPDSWGKQGFSLINQSTSGVEINYSVNTFSLTKSVISGLPMDVIKLPGHILPNKEGAPNLPATSRFIAIPQGAKAKLQIISIRTEIYKDIELAPSPRIPWETETGPLEYLKDESVFSSNKFYPEEPIIISNTDKIRGVDVVMLGITPFQYNPVTKELIVFRDIELKILFQGGNGFFGENRLRSRWWDPLFSDMILNYESLPEMNYNKVPKDYTKDTGCEYLIITPNGSEFQQWADSIRKFRTLQGILTNVVTLDEIGGNTAGQIEEYINNSYSTWDIVPVAILLLGDYGTNAANSIISPVWETYCVSDNVYADVNGNGLPDIIPARICAQNASQLETMVTKFLEYEKTPPVNNDYYGHPITSCFFQTGGWAQLLTESVGGFYEVVLNKNTNRINVCYGTLPGEWSTAQNTNALVDYFGPDGLGYIPATPGEVNCIWDGNTNDIINGINNGAFMLLHSGSGSVQGWGEPAFSNTDINALNNADLTFVWSIDCLAGKFNFAGECFAEKFHRHSSGGNNAGALGIIAASEMPYTLVTDIYAWGAFDNMWPDFMPDVTSTPESNGVLPAFANVAGKYYLEQNAWPFNPMAKEVTYNIFHYFGDAFSTVYTEMPQELDVSHPDWVMAGTTTFEVTANEGSLIALSVNGVLIGKAEGTGAPVLIDIPPQNPPDEILVTVTKQNYYRYEDLVPVGTGTGLKEYPKRDFIYAYPNPVTDNLIIKLPENIGAISIIISNLLSKLVYETKIDMGEEKILNIDMTGYNSGVYFIRIKSANIDQVKKIIVQ